MLNYEKEIIIKKIYCMRINLLSLFTVLYFSINAQNLNWELHATPLGRHIYSAKFIDGDLAIAVGGNPIEDSITSIFRTIDAGGTWNIITDVPFQPMQKDVIFTTTSIGYSVGDNMSIKKTINGGNNWQNLNAPSGLNTRNFNAIFFTDTLNGYIVGGNLSNDSIATILKTTDGGINWSISKDELNNKLNDIFFTDANTGFCVGNKGLLFKTINAGSTWTQQNISGGAGSRDFNAIHFVNNSTGFIVGGNLENDAIQTILKTTDGGTTWNVVRYMPFLPMLQDIDFFDTLNGLIVGNNGACLKTTDGGNTWLDESLPNVDSLWFFNSVEYVNSQTAIIGGMVGAVFVSTQQDTDNDTTIAIREVLANLNIDIYPNPFNNFLQINSKNNTLTQISIFNNLGQEVFKTFTKKKKNPINLNFLEKGTYFLKITNNKDLFYYHKILKS